MNRVDDKFTGAYVKDPKPGRYEWVYDLDLTHVSSINYVFKYISPEMKIGKINGWNAKEFIKVYKRKHYSLEKNGKEQGHMNNEELKAVCLNITKYLSSNGILYRNDKKGLIPFITF